MIRQKVYTGGAASIGTGHYEDQAAAIGVEPSPDAFVFSYEPDHSRPCNPDGISHRYVAMCTSLGIDSHPHALRHCTATELISVGVDVRTVAGRLGDGGGTTTLRVYTACVVESDKWAADILAGGVPPTCPSRRRRRRDRASRTARPRGNGVSKVRWRLYCTVVPTPTFSQSGGEREGLVLTGADLY